MVETQFRLLRIIFELVNLNSDVDSSYLPAGPVFGFSRRATKQNKTKQTTKGLGNAHFAGRDSGYAHFAGAGWAPPVFSTPSHDHIQVSEDHIRVFDDHLRVFDVQKYTFRVRKWPPEVENRFWPPLKWCLKVEKADFDIKSGRNTAKSIKNDQTNTKNLLFILCMSTIIILCIPFLGRGQ